MFGESRIPSTWYARTELPQKQAQMVLEKHMPAEVLTKAEHLMAAGGNILKITTSNDVAAGTISYYVNSSKYLTQDGFQGVTLTRVKNFSRAATKSKSLSFNDVKYECISLHKVIAYPCDNVECGYVFICSCLRFQVCYYLFYFILNLYKLLCGYQCSYLIMLLIGKRLYL